MCPLCKKVNNQFSVMTRFGKLMSTEAMLCLYKALILPHFYYCSMVWHFSSKQDSDKGRFIIYGDDRVGKSERNICFFPTPV